MSWVKIDDAILDNHKVAKIGPAAFGLYVAGMAYAARNLTDGYVPSEKVERLLNWDDGDDAVAALKELQRAHLWRSENGGFRIHDYLDYNPSRERVLADREAAKKRMQRVRSS